MEEKGCYSRTLVLVPGPFQGHITPMFHLGSILHSKGFPVIIVHTQFNFPDPSVFPNFTFVSIPDRVSNDDLAAGDLTGLVTTLNTNCEGPLCGVLSDMMKKEREPRRKAFCVIYDSLMYCAGTVAHHLNLDSLVLRPNSIATLRLYLAFPWLQKEGYLCLKDSTLQDPIPGVYPLRFRDVLLFGTQDVETWVRSLDKVTNIKTSSAIIFNTVECLEKQLAEQLQRRYQVPFFSIGPLHLLAPSSRTSILEEETDCLRWLDKQDDNSVIYVSLGSLALIDGAELVEMAWGLAKSGQRFLWVVRPSSIKDSEWIELLPGGFKDAVRERGCIVKWAPQKEVLAHCAVGGFWTHCGWNSTLEAICEGVPMICRPCFGDQKVNARYLCSVWRVGLELDGDLQKEDIERLVKRLMVGEEAKDLRQRAAALKYEVEKSVNEGGTSHAAIEELVNFITSL